MSSLALQPDFVPNTMSFGAEDFFGEAYLFPSLHLTRWVMRPRSVRRDVKPPPYLTEEVEWSPWSMSRTSPNKRRRLVAVKQMQFQNLLPPAITAHAAT